MWDLPGPGLEPVSPALAGGFLTTVPPGKPGGRRLLMKVFGPEASGGYRGQERKMPESPGGRDGAERFY